MLTTTVNWVAPTGSAPSLEATLDGAEAAYRAAIAADPGEAKAHLNLGVLLQVAELRERVRLATERAARAEGEAAGG